MNRMAKYQECAALGMSVKEAAETLRVTVRAVRYFNETHNLGFFIRPKEAGKPRILPLLEPHMTAKEIEDFKFLRAQKYSHRAALEAINRRDLLELLK